jgi:hypothetical protein
VKSEEHSMTKESRWLALFVAVAVAPALQAGQLKMRTAAVVDGTYAGRDQRTVRFQAADRMTERYAVIHTTDLTSLPRKAPAPPAATQAANAARAPQTVMVPAGTVLNVRLSQGIDVDATQMGASFKGRVDDPIMIDGRVVIVPPSGPLAANRPRYWTVEGDVLTIGTKDESGNPTTVGRWRRQAS